MGSTARGSGGQAVLAELDTPQDARGVMISLSEGIADGFTVYVCEAMEMAVLCPRLNQM